MLYRNFKFLARAIVSTVNMFTVSTIARARSLRILTDILAGFTFNNRVLRRTLLLVKHSFWSLFVTYSQATG